MKVSSMQVAQITVGERTSFRKFIRRSIGLWAIAAAIVGIGIVGCSESTPTKKVEKKVDAKSIEAADVRTQRNLQNAIAALQPDQLGISSDPERAIAVLNEWAEAAKKEAEQNGTQWVPRRSQQLLKSLPKDWVEQALLDKFIQRDGMFLRDCFWANKIAKLAIGNTDSEVDRIVNLFYYVVRNVELIPSGRRKVALGPFDVMVLGRGTVEDRVWIFSELLRQRQIDTVLLTPQGAKANEESWMLVGVLLDDEVYLFDPSLGMPIPADLAQPRSAMPRQPLTLKQAKSAGGLLTSIARDSAGRFNITASELASPQVKLICNTAVLSTRMKQLQQQLSGELTAVVSDPLEDGEDQPGLWSRVTQHPGATWNADDLVVWSYPENRREAASHMEPDQLKELSRLTYALGAPIRLVSVKEDKKMKQPPELIYGKPERALMKFRMNHVVGNWAEVVQGYLAAQLYEVDPPVTKDVYGQFLMGLKQAGQDSGDAKRLLRERIPKDIRDLHIRAGNDACYWMALCQAEQNRTKATIEQCLAYLDRYSEGSWTHAAKTLMAVSLAKQKRWKDAAQTIGQTEEESLDYGCHQILKARWRRMLAETQE